MEHEHLRAESVSFQSSADEISDCPHGAQVLMCEARPRPACSGTDNANRATGEGRIGDGLAHDAPASRVAPSIDLDRLDQPATST